MHLNKALPIDQDPSEKTYGKSRQFPVLPILWMAIGLFCGATFFSDSSDRALIGGFATVVATIPLLGLANSRIRWFHPLIFVFVPAAVGIAMRSWYLLYGEERPGAQRLLIGTHALDTAMLGSVVLGIALICLLLGFLIRSPRHSGESKSREGSNWIATWNWTNVILICSIAVSAVFTLVYIQAVGGISAEMLSRKRYVELDGGVSSSGAFVARGAAISAFAALPVIARLARDRSGPWVTKILAALAVVTSFITPFLGSSRAEIIALIIIVAVTWSSQRTRISMSLLSVGLATLFVLLSMGAIRCENQGGNADECSVAAEIEGSLLANENWMSVTKTAHIYTKVPLPVEYQGGRTFLSAVIAPIPRVIWPEKPNVRPDLLVGFEILELPHERRTGASPGIVGELYLNWGWPGILAGMFFLGWFLRRLWDWFCSTQSDFMAAIFAVVVTHIALRLPQGDFTGSFLPVMQGLVIIMVVKFVGSLVRQPKSVETDYLSSESRGV